MLRLTQSEAAAALRRIPVYLADDTDGRTPETGVSFAAGEIRVSKNGAAEVNHAGAVTEIAGGLYYYEATAAELDTLGFLAIRFSKTGVRTFAAVHQVVPAGLTATAVRTEMDANSAKLANLDAAVSSRLASAGYTAPPSTDGIWAAASRSLTDKAGFSLASAEHTSIADALLKRDFAAVTGEAARSALNALRAIRNKVTRSGSTLTVTKEDDATAAWTAAIATDATAAPITEVDPS